MPDSSFKRFSISDPLEQLVRIGVLTIADRHRLSLNSADVGVDVGGSGSRIDLQHLARELEDRGLATRHQAKAIAQGRIGDLKIGAYVVLDEIGAGGMGRVYKARHPLLERIVAIKTILASGLRSDEAGLRFETEMKAMGRISHPNVVAAQFAERLDDGSYYLVMDYVEGTDLFRLVHGSGSSFGEAKPLGWRTACSYVIQAALGLEEAHRHQIIHRDIKPNNLMLSKDGAVKALDLGLARFADGAGGPLTPTGSWVGTPDYTAPEQWADAKRVTAATDIYALGGVLYFLIAGEPPFGHRRELQEKIWAHLHEPPPKLRDAEPSAPKTLEAIFQKMVAKRPEERYRSMADVVSALQAVLASSPSPSTSESARPRAKRRSKRGRTSRSAFAVGLLAIVCLFAAIAVGVATSDRHRVADPRSLVDDPALESDSDSESEPPTPGFIESLGITMAEVPAGRFEMGSSAEEIARDERDFRELKGKIDNEAPKRSVEITKPFWISAREITVGQFRRFADERGYRTEAELDGRGGYGWDEAKREFRQSPEFTWKSPGFAQEDDHPVVNVSWNDAIRFCRWLSRKSGKAFTLPTEAQWERACRAGTSSRYEFGDDPAGFVKSGNAFDAAAKRAHSFTVAGATVAENQTEADDGYARTAPVGRFAPNSWGLYDMHGNVWEWCLDIYEEGYFGRAPMRDPLNADPAPDPRRASRRVIRGGSWTHPPGIARSAQRSWSSSSHRNSFLGFRVVAAHN